MPASPQTQLSLPLSLKPSHLSPVCTERRRRTIYHSAMVHLLLTLSSRALALFLNLLLGRDHQILIDSHRLVHYDLLEADVVGKKE
jgi:hypothetical protein